MSAWIFCGQCDTQIGEENITPAQEGDTQLYFTCPNCGTVGSRSVTEVKKNSS